MTSAPALTPIKFELRYRKRGLDYNKHAPKFAPDEFTVDAARLAKLPDVPAGFEKFEGEFGPVDAEANRLNTAQLRSGHLDYFFFAEIPGDFDPVHCDACKRLAVKDALMDD